MNLDHRITIERATFTAGAFNAPVPAWGEYVTVSAARRDASAGESLRAAEVAAKLDCRFTVRFSPEIATVTAKDRIVLEGGPTFDIVGVRETKRNEWVEIDCVARPDR